MRTYPESYLIEPIKYIYIFISYEAQRLNEIYDKQGDENLNNDIIFKDFFNNKKPILHLQSTVVNHNTRKINSTLTKPNRLDKPTLLPSPACDPITISVITAEKGLIDSVIENLIITQRNATRAAITKLKLNETYAFNSIRSLGEICSRLRLKTEEAILNELNHFTTQEILSQAIFKQSSLNSEEFKSYVSYFITICYRLPFESNLIFHLIYEDLSKNINPVIQDQKTWQYFDLYVIELVFLNLFKDFKINESTSYTDSNLVTYLNVSYEQKLFDALKRKYVEQENRHNRPDDFVIIEEMAGVNTTTWCNFQNLNGNRCTPFQHGDGDGGDDDDDDGDGGDDDDDDDGDGGDDDDDTAPKQKSRRRSQPPGASSITLRSHVDHEMERQFENMLYDLTHWTQVDDWVKQYLDLLKQSGKELSVGTDNTMIAQDSRLMRSFPCISGSTIYEAGSSGETGKNDCLIHSILAAISTTFRQIGGHGDSDTHNRNRNYIANFFRRSLIPYWMQQFGFTLSEPNTLKDILGEGFLEERVGEDICKKLQLNVIFLQRGAALTSGNIFNHTIGIFGDHVHFQPVSFTISPSQKCSVEIISTETHVGFILPTTTLDPVFWQENVLLKLGNRMDCSFQEGQRVTINGNTEEQYEVMEVLYSTDNPERCDRLRLEGPFVMVQQKRRKGQKTEDITESLQRGENFKAIDVPVEMVTLLQNGGNNRNFKRISKKTLNKRISKKTLKSRISKKTLNKRISKKQYFN
jgi:hypothetical protein